MLGLSVQAHVLQDRLDALHRVLGPPALLVPPVQGEEQLLLQRGGFGTEPVRRSTASTKLMPCWRKAPKM